MPCASELGPAKPWAGHQSLAREETPCGLVTRKHPRRKPSRLGQVLTPHRSRAELYQPCTVEPVDAVILAKMARQRAQVSLRGNPFWFGSDFVGVDLAPFDWRPAIEQRFDAFLAFLRL